MTARRLHRITAYPVAVFIALHLANHITLFWGPEAHLAVQSLLRPIYRNPAV
jgi:succinate dehydrogenase/fumarate reductase cytochrome b subunit